MTAIASSGVVVEGNAPSTKAQMKAARRWLLASPTKVPHYVDGTSRRGTLDTADDMARLASFEDAATALQNHGPGWHLGFALGPDGTGKHWQGIDLDHIEENCISEMVADLPGYVEHSPSRKGVHAIGYGRHFETLGSNRSGIEAYAAGRYFTVTRDMIRDGNLVCLAEHVAGELAERHRSGAKSETPTQTERNREPAAEVEVRPEVIEDLRSALSHLDPNSYAPWVETGIALKCLGKAGLGLWLEWSASYADFDNDEASKKWESFKPEKTSYKSVFAKAQLAGWMNPSSRAATEIETAREKHVRADPFVMPDIFGIKPRRWVFGRWLLRGTVTAVIAPGGMGKSALMVGAALSLSTGRDFLGKEVWEGPMRVWLWNLEDDREELSRQIAAACLHHGIFENEFAGRLFVNGAESPLCLAVKSRDGLAVNEELVENLIGEIKARGVDVLFIDPFVSSHRAEENDNGQIDVVVKLWARIAREANCSVVLVHHSRKLGGQSVDAESSRGASALGNAARSVLVLNRMEKGEATRLGIPVEDCRRFFRVSNDKSNRAPAEAADWMKLVSVSLGNDGPAGADSVAVVESWTPPEMTTIYGNELREKVKAEIASGQWRSHSTAKDWAGNAIANLIGEDVSAPAGKHRVSALLKDMFAKNELFIEERMDENRHWRKFVTVSGHAAGVCDSPAW